MVANRMPPAIEGGLAAFPGFRTKATKPMFVKETKIQMTESWFHKLALTKIRHGFALCLNQTISVK